MGQKQIKFLGSPFTGDGQMGVLMRQFDWANTVLGPVKHWSQSLRTAVSILLNCPHPMFVCWGREFIILYNDAYVPLIANKHPHALGQKIPHVLPELWSVMRPIVQEITNTREPVSSQEIQLFADLKGYLEEIYVTFSCNPICHESGDIEGIFVNCTAITPTAIAQNGTGFLLKEIRECAPLTLCDRKPIETLSLDSEERLRLALEGADLGMWDYDLITGQLLWSNRCKAMFGLNLDTKMSYEVFINTIHPQDRLRVEQAIQQAITGQSKYNVECRVLWADGNAHWLAFRGHAYQDENGTPVRMAGVVLNITARKSVEQQLYQSQAHLAMAQRVAQVGSWEFDIETQKVSWSEITFLHWGIDPERGEPTYLELLERVYPEDREILQKSVERAIVEGVAYAFDMRIFLNDGSIRYLDSRGEPIFNEKGQAIKLIGTSLDITERKQTELALQQAKEAAETASQLKDEFLTILSHELRSPLNPILAWSQVLRSRKLNEATTERALETIERNAKLQTQLIDDLLDMSRILQGKLNLNIKPVNLVFIIKNTVELIRQLAEAKGIQIQTVLDLKTCQIEGDSTRLQQIIWNLLSNAIKFTPEGGQVTVNLEYLDSYAQIQVRDTGQGISPEFLPHVFERFRQESTSTTRKYSGLGLGLSIVRHLTKLHGGSVQAESPGLGLGATFTVELPLIVTDSKETAKEEQIKTQMNFNGLRVLIVDDEVDLRELIAELLEDLGATVTVASSAPEALRVFEQQTPDLLLSDIGMPEMDGYMLIRQIRLLPSERGGKIPAIALTAYAEDCNREKAIAAGFQMHIAKPVELRVLLEAIATLVGR
ncbi:MULTISPECIES: PAS domain-containing hybrid sensor histidine kinase/response regulator [Nostocales]|nr:PAS domain-containing protein [Tolypothrix bouteillei]